jgi:hypothetical protein
LKVDLDRLSRKPEGDRQDGLPTTRQRVGTVDTRSGKLEILLDRIDRRGESPIWLFSSETLALIPAAATEAVAVRVDEAGQKRFPGQIENFRGRALVRLLDLGRREQVESGSSWRHLPILLPDM